MTNPLYLNRVIGYPLAHTKSPLLHNTLYQALNISAELRPFPGENLKTQIQAIQTLSTPLTAVTMPFKQAILDYLDSQSPEVISLKAANTLIQREGKLYGYNTDIDGIAYALRGINITGKRVLIIGSGGVAHAVGYFMQKNKAHLFWLNRSPEKALMLSKIFGGDRITPLQLTSLPLDIIVNATPVGMHPNDEASPLPGYIFNAEQVVFDVIYHPMMTTLLKQAKKNQAATISGLEMFIGQGIKQVELWTGKSLFNQTSLIQESTQIIRHAVS